MDYSSHIKVISMRGGLSQELGWIDVRIDRASVLGNPFEFSNEKMRSQSIAAFRKWLWQCIKYSPNEVISPANFLTAGLKVSKTWKKPKAKQVVAELNRLTNLLKLGKSLRLSCWCGEGRCHADVIKACLLWMLTNW